MDTSTMMLSVLEHLAAAETDMPSESRQHVTSAIASLSSAFDLSLDNPKQVCDFCEIRLSTRTWSMIQL